MLEPQRPFTGEIEVQRGRKRLQKPLYGRTFVKNAMRSSNKRNFCRVLAKKPNVGRSRIRRRQHPPAASPRQTQRLANRGAPRTRTREERHDDPRTQAPRNARPTPNLAFGSANAMKRASRARTSPPETHTSRIREFRWRSAYAFPSRMRPYLRFTRASLRCHGR